MSARVESGSEFESTAAMGPAAEHGFDVPAWQRAGCLRNPCSADPDPALFFASPEVRQIRDTLLATARGESASLSVLTGPAGIGKTSLLREVELALTQGRRRVAFLSCAHAEVPWRDVIESAAGPLVLLLDDAENCGDPWFEELEKWLAGSAGGRPCSHLVISARPEAAARLERLVEIASGAGLTAVGVTLEPLDAVMVGEFLAHRLWRSGYTGAWPLDEATVHRIADRSSGVPANILRLSAIEFEAAWAEEAVFAPRRAATAAPVPVPTNAPVPAVAAPGPRRLLSDPTFRTAMAATTLLAVAGTAGWLAWRTVETARVGLVEVAPPAQPPAGAVAAVPTAPYAEPAATSAALERKVPATATAAVASGALPSPAAERLSQPTARPADMPRQIGTVMLSARTAEPAPMPMVAPTPVVEPELAEVAEAIAEAEPVVEPSVPLAPLRLVDDPFRPEPPTSADIASAAPTVAPAAEEEAPTAPVVAQADTAPPTDPPAAADNQASEPTPAAEVAVEPVTEPSTAAPPAETLTQIAQATMPPAAESDSSMAASPALAPSKVEEAASPPPPSSSPTLPAVAPSAGVPPAPPLTPAQIASYVRRGDEYVQTGDIAAARLWYERAAMAGDAGAMLALGRTYDARVLRQWGVIGMPADQARAEEWYRKAAAAQGAASPRQ